MILGFVFGALLATVPSVMSFCHEVRLDGFPEVCFNDNLTLVSTIIQDKELVCNGSVPHTLLETPPNVYLDKSYGNQSEQSDLVLLAFDATLNQLLWTLANITLGDENIVSQADSKTQILKPYQTVTVDPLKKKHILVFAVFERKSNNSTAAQVTVNPSIEAAFSLSEWTANQSKSGVELCGPVAVAQIIVSTEPQCNVANPPSTVPQPLKQQSRSEFQLKGHAKSYRTSLNPRFNSFYAMGADLPPKSESNKQSEPGSKGEKPVAQQAQPDASIKVSTWKPLDTPEGERTTPKVARAANPGPDVEETMTAAGDAATVAGAATTVAGDAMTAAGDATTAAGGATAAAGGEATTAAGDATTAAGDATTAPGAVTTVAGAATTAAGEATTGKAGEATVSTWKLLDTPEGERTAPKVARAANPGPDVEETMTAAGDATTAPGAVTTVAGAATTAAGEATTGKAGEATTGKTGEATTGKVGEATTGTAEKSTTPSPEAKKNFAVNFKSNLTIVIFLLILSTLGISVTLK